MREQLTKAITETLKAWQDTEYETLDIDKGNMDSFTTELIESAMGSLQEPCVMQCGLDYRSEYHRLCERYKEVQEEKERLNKALINVASRL